MADRKYPRMVLLACVYCGRISWARQENYHETRRLHYCPNRPCADYYRKSSQTWKAEAKEKNIPLITMMKIKKSVESKTVVVEKVDVKRRNREDEYWRQLRLSRGIREVQLGG